MAEDSVEKELGEVIKLNRRRREAGKPSQEEIAFVMQQNVLSVRPDIIAGFTGEQNIALLKQLLEEYKSNAQKKAGVSLSKPLLCATFLSRSVGDHLTSEARNAFNENKMAKFRFCYDSSIGLIQSLDRVMSAEMELSDAGERERLKVVSYQGDKLKMPVAEQTQQYLNMKREDAESLELLRKDHSGFLLMDGCAEEVKAGSWDIISYEAKEYVLAGAELARDLYKQLYEIAAPLYPEKESK